MNNGEQSVLGGISLVRTRLLVVSNNQMSNLIFSTSRYMNPIKIIYYGKWYSNVF
jgi:hypothetical protein